MTRNSDNRKRIFADVVTIDAWHEELGKSLTADLHADVVFGTARVGGEETSKVRFRLSVKRAEVVIIIPETEPICVVKSSVARDSPALEATRKGTIEKSADGNANAKASSSLSESGLAGSLQMSADASASIKLRTTLELNENVAGMAVTQSKTDDGHYRWKIEPKLSPILEGRPWDSKNKPLLTLRDKRIQANGIHPTVHVEVRCRREDIAIEEIELKDTSLWDSLKGNAGHKNRLAAAESYIRDRLVEEGLDVKNIADKFGMVTFANVIADIA